MRFSGFYASKTFEALNGSKIYYIDLRYLLIFSRLVPVGKAQKEKAIDLLTYYPIIDREEKIPTVADLSLEQDEFGKEVFDNSLWEISSNSFETLFQFGLSVAIYWLYRHQDGLEQRFFR